MSGSSRANAPVYSFATMMNQVQGTSRKTRGMQEEIQGGQEARDIFAGSQPLAGLPIPQRKSGRKPSVEPERELPMPRAATEDQDLQCWVTVYGANWDTLASVRTYLSYQYGPITNCMIPEKRGNGAHFEFARANSASMLIQERTIRRASFVVHATQCKDRVC